MNISLGSFIIITVALSIGAALQGSIGYGMGILVTPVLVLVNQLMVPGPFLLAALVLVVLVVLRERQSVDLYGLRWVLLGSIPAAILGAQLIASFSIRAMNIAFGAVILLAVVMSLIGVCFPPFRWVLVVAGILSGFMGVVGGVGGPPLALVYQDSSPERLRSTLSGYFIVATLVTLIALIPVGRLGFQELKLTLVQLPGIVLGFLISSRLMRMIDARSVRGVVLAISAVSAVVVITKQFIH
jgi:uncharacterized protein